MSPTRGSNATGHRFGCPSSWRNLSGVLLGVTATVLILIPYGARWELLKTRGFDQDEFEHVHAGWSVSRGLLPYRDFFEVHTPGIYFFLSLFFPFFQVETNVEDALRFLIFARQLTWIWTGIGFALTFCLAWRWRGSRTALAGTFFLAHCIMYLEKTLEVRPDVFSTALWLGCLGLLVWAVQEEAGASRKVAVLFAASGLCLGVAVMFTQKILLAGPGFATAMLWYLTDRRGHGPLPVRLRNSLLQLAGFLLPVLLTGLYFLSRDALGAFVEYNLLWTLGWKSQISPYPSLHQLVRQNPFLVALGGVGLLRYAVTSSGRAAVRRGDFLLVLNTAGLILGLFIMPSPYRQYFLTFLPLVAIFAGALLVEGIETTSGFPRNARGWRDYLTSGSVALLVTGALWYTLPQARPPLLHPPPVAVWGGIAVAMILTIARLRDVALALLLCVLSLQPLDQLQKAFAWRNEGDLAQIRYVMENTSPTDTVMDGWTGYGVFRPQAHFFGLLHHEVRMMLTDTQKAEVLAGLRSGAIAPELLLLDGELRDLSAEVTAFFEEHYEATGVGSIWRRRGTAPAGRGR